MEAMMGRREFLQWNGTLAAATAGAFLQGCSAAPSRQAASRTPNADRLGWQLSVQMYTYRRYPLFEALDKVAALGIRHVEPRSGLKLDKDRPGVKVNEDLPPGLRKELKDRMGERGLRLSSFYPDFGTDPGQARKVFEFCREMGTVTIVAEPPAAAIDTLEKLAEEYGIGVALHNHQQGASAYWNPEIVLAACKGRGRRMGGCCDVGQWARSGLDPVECLRQMDGRVVSVHLKDVLQKGNRGARNTVFGEGQADVGAALKELKRLGYRGLVTIDFEHDTPALQEDMARNVSFVEEQARMLGPS